MLSFHVKFVQTEKRSDGQTERRTLVKQYAPDFSIRGHKMSLSRTYSYVKVFSRARSHCSLFPYNSTSIRCYLYLENYPYVK